MPMVSNDRVGDVHTYNMYPLTIIFDRYSGCYSGGKVTAWNCHPETVPDEIYSDDNTCSYFWSSEAEDMNVMYGIGNNIQEAIDDLYFKDPNPFINIKGDLWCSMNTLNSLREDQTGVLPCFSFTLSEAVEAIDKYKQMKREHEKMMIERSTNSDKY